MAGRAVLWTGPRVLRQFDSKCYCRHGLEVVSSGPQPASGDIVACAGSYSACSPPSPPSGSHPAPLLPTRRDCTSKTRSSCCTRQRWTLPRSGSGGWRPKRLDTSRFASSRGIWSTTIRNRTQQYRIQPRRVSPVAHRMQDELQGLSGPWFDYEYITTQVIYKHSSHYFYRREERHGLDGLLHARGGPIG
jgi:hypothetical protein